MLELRYRLEGSSPRSLPKAVTTAGVRLDGSYLQALQDGDWRSAFAWDGASRSWLRTRPDAPVDELQLFALEPAGHFQLEVIQAGDTLSDTEVFFPAGGYLALDRGRHTRLWARTGSGEELLARLSPLGDWEVDDQWSNEAIGKIVIRACVGSEGDWDGRVGVRGRLSILAARA